MRRRGTSVMWMNPMPEASRYIRDSFVEAFRWLRRVSIRSWILVFFGPLFALLAAWIGRIPASVVAVAAAPLVTVIVASVAADVRRKPFGTWLTKAVVAWAIAYVAVSIIAVPKHNLHDELLITQVAMEKISDGEDPYGANYRGTIVDLWTGHELRLSYVNGVYPGWDHYVYLPGFFAVSYPVYLIVHGLTGAYDQRIVYLIAYAALTVGAWMSLKRSPIREPLTLVFVLNPFFMNVTYGFNDLLPIALFAVTGYLMAHKKLFAAAVCYGLMLATKQTMALTIPFMIPAFIHTAATMKRSAVPMLAAVAATAALVILPFFLWSPSRFFNDTVSFFFSSTAYPIHGEGLSGLLKTAGLVTENQYFPFWIFQIFATLPLAAYFMRRTLRSPDLHEPFFGSAVTIGVLWFFSRYFLTSHAHGIILLLALSFIISESQRSYAS